jgi:hypothetical protein
VFEKDLSSALLSRIVERQLGHITRAQLLDAGWSTGAIKSHVRRGLLIPVHAGVYAVGHVPRHAHARSMAAVLAGGDGAALSHHAAAALWDVMDWPATLEIVAPHQHRRPGLRCHRSATLTRRDIRRRHGLPVTSPARTILDLQPRLTSDLHLQRLINDLRVARHLNQTVLKDLCARSPRINGLLGDSERPTRSILEDRFKAFLEHHHLPLPEFNVTVDGRELDALYREQRLIIELDSWGYHGDRQAFRRDRRKDGRALADGLRTLRIATDQLDDETADALRRALDQYRPSPRS